MSGRYRVRERPIEVKRRRKNITVAWPERFKTHTEEECRQCSRSAVTTNAAPKYRNARKKDVAEDKGVKQRDEVPLRIQWRKGKRGGQITLLQGGENNQRELTLFVDR